VRRFLELWARYVGLLSLVGPPALWTYIYLHADEAFSLSDTVAKQSFLPLFLTLLAVIFVAGAVLALLHRLVLR
jgi:hypothetical protein